MAELRRIAASHLVPALNARYGSIRDYLVAVGSAAHPPRPYVRSVDVLWDTSLGYGARRYFDGRTLEVTYSGNVRTRGGFAAQCYVVVDPNGFGVLGPFHRVPIQVEIIAGTNRDLLIVSV
jgi:hypothetical protein